MSKEIKITCDNCGALRQETNHWFKIGERELDAGLVIVPAKQANTAELITEWDACGAKCAVEMVSRFLSTGKIERT